MKRIALLKERQASAGAASTATGSTVWRRRSPGTAN